MFLPIAYKWIIFNEEFCTWLFKQNQEEFDAIKHMLRQAKCLVNWGVLLDMPNWKNVSPAGSKVQ
jgi:hypothetical protein